jgi:protein-tyrosine phosphatase
MQRLVQRAGLSDAIQVDSAGTAGYHAGERSDGRARAAALRRGIEISHLARRFEPRDWDRFHYVLAMDLSNYDDLSESAPSPAARAKLHLLRSFDPKAPRNAAVPDPYYGGDQGFDDVLDLCEAACTGLLEHIRRERNL